MAACSSLSASTSLVRVSRTIRRSDTLDGFVVGLGEAWLLLAVLDHTIHLDGYAALRLGDVSEVERRGGPATFVGRALAARAQWPPVAVDVDLDSVAALVRSASEVAPLVTLHIEVRDPTVGFIGRPVRFTSRSVTCWRSPHRPSGETTRPSGRFPT